MTYRVIIAEAGDDYAKTVYSFQTDTMVETAEEAVAYAKSEGGLIMNLAEKYNAEVARLLPHMADDLTVDPLAQSPHGGNLTAEDIDDITFRRSEYLGGMACAVLAMISKGDA